MKASSIYWLTGLAGLGKTTIAYTICEELEEANIPFVSFFCSQQLDSKSSTLITTICHDLAEQFSSFASELLDVLVRDWKIKNANLPRQMEKLFVNPWEASLTRRKCLAVPIVVIDALDAVDKEDCGSVFLMLLLKALEEKKLSGIKFLVASRPEPRLFGSCKNFPPNVVCKLHEIDVSNVQKDIEKYLFSALPDLNDGSNLEKLASQAEGHFIYAATAVKFISDPLERSTDEKCSRLQKVLNSWPVSSGESKQNPVHEKYKPFLDELYTTILGDAISDDHISYQRLRILHTVLYAKSRISISVIAKQSNTDEDTAENTVRSLYAVLFVSSKDECVYWCHSSFFNFIFSEGQGKFGMLSQKIDNESVHYHAILTYQCFYTMKRQLHFNMCNLNSSFQFDSEVPGLNDKKLRELPPILRYASQYWAKHLSQVAPAGDESNDLTCHLDDFMCNKLLFWIEVMNLIDARGDCELLLRRVEEWLKKVRDASSINKNNNNAV